MTFSIIGDLPNSLEASITNAITSVFEQAEPSWHVTLAVQTEGAWKLFAQPIGGESREKYLDEHQRSPEAIREVVSRWYEEFNHQM